jgi:hypothetical protein
MPSVNASSLGQVTDEEIKMRTVARMLVAFAMLAWGATANAAPVIFDNGITAANSFVSDIDFPMFVADDFTLNPGANIVTDVHWTGLYFDTNTPLTDTFTIQFFTDVGGSPALAPFLSLAVSPTRTDTGTDLTGSDLFAYDVNIAPVAFTPNTTFWISIFNDTTNDTDDNWFWGMVDQAGNSFNRESDSAPWEAQNNGQEFQLTGIVPQSSALALYALGIVTVVVLRKAKSKGASRSSVQR